MFAPMFPAPSAPVFPDNQSAKNESYLRYEDIAQDGRLMPIAVPPALAGLWRTILVKHPGANAAAQTGIIPILTRLTIGTTETAIRVDRPIETTAGFELAHDRDASGEVSRLFMNVWCEVSGLAGKIVPRTPAGPLTRAGYLFAEHVFTRPFGPPDQRKITKLSVPGYPELPEARYPSPAPRTASEAPDGATWLDELAPDTTDVVFTLDQTDSNQHVNSLVYIRIFLDAVNRRLAAAGKPLHLRSRAVDIAYRKPCFAGDRVRAHVRLFEVNGTLGAAGFIAKPGEEAKPGVYVRVTVGA